MPGMSGAMHWLDALSYSGPKQFHDSSAIFRMEEDRQGMTV